MTDEKNPQEWRYLEDDRSESLENTQAISQENKSPDDSLGWKTGAWKVMLPAIICFAYLLIEKYQREVNAHRLLSSLGFIIPFCFMLMGVIMGACVKEQHDRIRKLETTLAARDELPSR
jgi:p-aminobenzoyl-glutamate transporter AbgT